MWPVAQSLAAIDPTLPSLIGAIATLAATLGITEWRRRARRDKTTGDAAEVAVQVDVDRQAAETILTQWKAVLEATQAGRAWEAEERRRCEERNAELGRRIDDCESKIAVFEKERAWEAARHEWLDSQPKRRKRADDET